MYYEIPTEKERKKEISKRKLRYGAFNFLCGLLPYSNEIILESYPDMSCSTYELYRLFTERNVNGRFRITWLSDDPEKLRETVSEKNVDFIEISPKSFAGRVKKYIRCSRAKMLITANRHYQRDKTGKKQINVYIVHGSPMKFIYLYKEGMQCDFIISQSDFFKGSLSRMYSFPEDRIKGLGFPRNDQLFRTHDSLKRIYKDIPEFDKVICWVPTFRRHRDKRRVDCSFDFPLGIPVIYSEDGLRKFNDRLRSQKVLVIFKPHPAADLDVIKKMELSNFRFLYNDDLFRHGIQTNEFLAQTDAMIGDYSGIYFDYLLLDRPIGITLDDFDAYSRETTFAFDDPLEVLAGEYIRSVSDMERFVDNVVNGRDEKFSERERIKKLTNANIGCAAEAVYDFLNGQMKERFNNSLGD